MNKTGKKERIVLAALLLLITIGVFWFGWNKTGYHIDEMYSYGLANSNYQPFLHMGDTGAYDVEDFMQEYGTGNNIIDLCSNAWKDVVILSKAKLKFQSTEIYQAYRTAQQTSNDTLTTTWLSGEYFNDYLTVEKGTGFNYASVYYNQRGDVHPPLYYILLHTVSSFFPGTFSKWFGITINYLALMATLILLYKMILRFVGSSLVALSTVAIYGASTGFMETAVFLRMYAVLTLLTVAYCFYFLYMNEKQWEFTRKRKGGLVALTILGFYTQYFFVVYAVLMMLVVCAILIAQKKIKVIWTYIRQLIWAAVLGVVIWPFCIGHVFGGYRGKSVSSSLFDLGDSLDRIKRMGGEMAYTCLGNHTWILLLLLFMALGGLVLRRIEGKKDIGKYFILFFPAIIYFVLIAKAAPFSSDRYVMNIMPFMMIMMAMSIHFWMVRMPSSRKVRNVLCIVLFTLLLGITNAWTVAPRYVSDAGQENVEIPENTTAIYVLEPQDAWPVYTTDALALSKCNRVMILFSNQLDFLSGFVSKDGEKVMVFLRGDTMEHENIMDTLSQYLELDRRELQYTDTSEPEVIRYLYE